MKQLFIWSFITIVLLGGSAVADEKMFLPRKFTSADGKKSMFATPIGYRRHEQIIVLKTEDNAIKNVPIEKFSIEDRLFILDHSAQLVALNVINSLPMSVRHRFTPASRAKMRLAYPMAAGSDAAIEKWMQRLKTTQSQDGSWCSHQKPAMTGLALLVFFGQGETPESKEYGVVIKNGINYLVRIALSNKGRISVDLRDRHWPYQHAIATYALAEALIVCQAYQIKIPNLEKVVKAAGDFILEHQHQSGGWEYSYDQTDRRGGDVSLTVWQMHALKACRLTGLWKDKHLKNTARNALDYIKSKQNANGGIGYNSLNPSTHGFTLTGAGMTVFQIWGKGHDSVCRKGDRYLRANWKFNYETKHADLYALYYNISAMKNRGGSAWIHAQNLLGNQLSIQQNEDGSWKNVGSGAKIIAVAPVFQGGSPDATHYRSCLCALILQTPYRYAAPKLIK